MKKSWDEMYKNMWDERYKETTYAYGKGPNVFFKEWLEKFTPGTILMPADGEGRNGVFAACLGWKVTSFDLSIEGKAKALALAKEFSVTLDYIVADLEQLDLNNESFDAIGLIYAHFAADKKEVYHAKLNKYLKPGGLIILEAFSKNHIALNECNPSVGGPKDIDMLYSKGQILADFGSYELLILEEEEIELNEGKYHIGKGSVIRFVGRKM
ncbi:class I SAM-dependent methyltransferase [Ferruginibacter paludis]|uniref:class I SAM-dependent methyltransferase n=1 Tax=Ferruginibacter paludis TaxID=1310417 RepID=UPI0025B52106|nr:class I SAM-dependent methyltransferase [Ferruginibacter paludis]MDN3654169.1 class I SAM-dependent methyltransferase [Ferruginibacter paludis]